MRPHKFSIQKDGSVRYHYKFSDLRELLTLGFRDGNVGWILTKRQGNFKTFRGFGTIENPCYKIMTISMMHFDLFDGLMPTDEQICAPINLERDKEEIKQSYRFEILDLNGKGPETTDEK